MVRVSQGAPRPRPPVAGGRGHRARPAPLHRIEVHEVVWRWWATASAIAQPWSGRRRFLVQLRWFARAPYGVAQELCPSARSPLVCDACEAFEQTIVARQIAHLLSGDAIAASIVK